MMITKINETEDLSKTVPSPLISHKFTCFYLNLPQPVCYISYCKIIIRCNIMSQESFDSADKQFYENTKHKVELCRAYAETGVCPYGQFCMFAHGVEELLKHQPILKIKKCRNYHTHGYCRFGERCNFRHEKNAKPRKKKNLYKFHKILNSYPELILGCIINKSSRSSSISDCSESSIE